MSAVVKSAAEGSIAHEAGIEKGDILLTVNGQKVTDILAYRFLSAGEEITLELEKKNSDIEIIEIINEDYEDLGIEFENWLIDKPKSCRNKCVFCFVDQLPKGMRKTLYFKDDDYRLSALMGNYITLTNLSEEDIRRIIEMRLPRINVSVHTVDPALRQKMLNNKNSDVLPVMKRFAKAGIFMNCQIVLCRGINDGDSVDETVKELACLYPQVQSVSVVPVGLTAHRDGLPQLKGFDPSSAKEVIERLKTHQKRCLTKLKTRFVFPSDEFYITAGEPFPSYGEYEDFLQIENGVGLVSSLEFEFEQAVRAAESFNVLKNKSIVTGVSAAPFLKKLTDMLGGVSIHAIKNTFFGENITVAGLITGQDIISQLKGRETGTTLLIPSCMLNTDGVFLDDLTVNDVETALNVKIETIKNDGYELFKALTGGNDV